MGRWDRYFEARRQTSEEWLIERVVRSLVNDLAGWPPPVAGWNDEAAKARFAAALSPLATRPAAEVFRAAFQLAVWELERNYDALDDWARNDRAATVATEPAERQSLELLHHWLTDSMLELLELSSLRRPQLIDCLRRTQLDLAARGR